MAEEKLKMILGEIRTLLNLSVLSTYYPKNLSFIYDLTDGGQSTGKQFHLEQFCYNFV